MKNITFGANTGGTGSASGPEKPAIKLPTPSALDEYPLKASRALAVLTADESAELERLEKVIKGGWKTFLEVGTALAEVRNKKLYRDKYDSIEEYCLAELGFSRPYAYNLIGSAEVSKQLSSIEDIKFKPVNEAQCRELLGVPEEKRVDAWKKAIEVAGEKPLTAKIVHQAVAKFKPKKTGKRNAAKKPAAAKKVNFGPVMMLLDDIEGLAAKEKNEKLTKKVAALREWLEKQAGKGSD